MRGEMIRKALISDVKNIQQLINSVAGEGVVLPRSLSELYDNLRDYSVYCHGTEETIYGTCAIHVCWENLAEIRSLVVRKDCGKRGVGKALVESCLAEAHTLGIRRVFVLTYKESFFEKLGFRTIDKSALPHKSWSDCLKCAKFPDCDEVAMEKEL